MTFLFNIMLMFLLGSCTLAENKKPEEGKDYTDVVHEVELVDYEFEERLNSFYESEPIDPQELSDLYEGEFPENNSNPRELRIHWKDARELALAELELQKPIHTSWKDATISERPILVLDRDGGDFYRYYEYRIVQDKKFLGAIRIPTYRRTENFATAEVHLYSDDEKTYTIHPTGWGQYISKNSIISEKSSFYKEIEDSILPYLTDNVVYNWVYRIYEQLEVKDENVIDPKQNYDILKEFYTRNTSAIPELKNTLSKDQQDIIIENMTRYQLTEVNNTIQEFGSMLIKLELIAHNISDFHVALKDTTLISYSNFYIQANNYALSNMTYSTKKNTHLQVSLKNIIWDMVEKNIHSHKKLTNIQWEFGTLFTVNNITPIIQYNNFNSYPQRNVNNNQCGLISSQYTLLTIEDHENAMLLSAGLSTDTIGIELYNSILNQGSFINENIPNNLLKNALLLNNSNINSRFSFILLNVLLMPVKALLLDIIDKEIGVIINEVTSSIDLPLEKLIKLLKMVVNNAPPDAPQLQEYKNFIKLLDIVINNPENVGTDVLSRMFGSWSVWVIPILPFPTWVHYTDQWGPVPQWQMIMGWPNFWTLKEFPLPNFDWLQPIPKPPVEEVSVPEGLEDHQNQWSQVQLWLQENEVLVANEDGSFKYGTETQVQQVVNLAITWIKQVYIHKIVVDYSTGEPIISPTEEQLDHGFEELLNYDGQELISQIIPNLPSMSEFKYIK